MKRVIVLAGVLFMVWAPEAEAARKAHAMANMKGLDGKALGTVDFEQTNHGVLITFDLHGLPPGAHAIHIHTSGNCDPKVKFTAAGPHFSPEPRNHGFMVKGGPHPGDLPNQFADAAGVLHAATLTNAFSLGNGKRSIFDRNGASIIVHARSDDYTSQPDGNSGDRIACGVIKRLVGPTSRNRAKRNMHK